MMRPRDWPMGALPSAVAAPLKGRRREITNGPLAALDSRTLDLFSAAIKHRQRSRLLSVCPSVCPYHSADTKNSPLLSLKPAAPLPDRPSAPASSLTFSAKPTPICQAFPQRLRTSLTARPLQHPHKPARPLSPSPSFERAIAAAARALVAVAAI